MKTEFFILFMMLFINASCAAPPPSKPIEIIIDSPPIIQKENISSVKSFKNLDSTAKQVIQNSTLIVYFYKDYKIEEHEMIIVPQDLDDGYIFKHWGFSMNSSGINLDEIINSCQIIDEKGVATQDINCNASISFENPYINFIYNYKLHNTETLKIKIKFEKQLDNEILYKTENAVIPFIEGSSFCNYTYILPEGYKNLGLTYNILTKELNNIYTYYGNCPQETIYDVLHFSPEKTYWKAEAKTFLSNAQKIKYDATFLFPRYYRGAKLNNTFYKITSSKNESYEEENVIYDDLKFKVTVPTPNQETVSVNLNTGFINDLNNDFKVTIPESYYEINETDIPEEIKIKAQEIKRDNPDKPYYYIGKFINNYLTYNLNYIGQSFTAKQIYENKQGVCEHYTILYNAMLNSIGIKSLYISGWAFQGAETSGDQDTVGHAWTAALIDDKWIELDATWGLFEGIPSGHIFKTFFSDSYSYSWNSKEEGKMEYSQNRTIQLYGDINDILENEVNNYISDSVPKFKSASKFDSSFPKIEREGTTYISDTTLDSSYSKGSLITSSSYSSSEYTTNINTNTNLPSTEITIPKSSLSSIDNKSEDTTYLHDTTLEKNEVAQSSELTDFPTNKNSVSTQFTSSSNTNTQLEHSTNNELPKDISDSSIESTSDII